MGRVAAGDPAALRSVFALRPRGPFAKEFLSMRIRDRRPFARALLCGALGLGERLRVGVHGPDRLERRPGMGQQGVLDLLEVLAGDVHVVGEQTVEHGQDRTRRGVLDRHDQPLRVVRARRELAVVDLDRRPEHAQDDEEDPAEPARLGFGSLDDLPDGLEVRLVDRTLGNAIDPRASQDYAFVATRPPGHHARADAPMGFCFLNNAAIAAHYVSSTFGTKPQQTFATVILALRL